MADLRIAWSAYRNMLIAYRGEVRGSTPGSQPSEPPANGEAAQGNRRAPPIVDPRLLSAPSPLLRQTVSPRFAARIYEANVPTKTYAYPFVTTPEENETLNATGDGRSSPVTMVPYEPGTLVDRYA